MKRFIICFNLFIAFSSIILFAQERISLFNDQVVFYVPEGTVEALQIQGSIFGFTVPDYEEYKKFYTNNQISFSFSMDDVDTYINLAELDFWGYDNDISRHLHNLAINKRFYNDGLLDLLLQPDISPVFSRGVGMIRSTYTLIEYNSEIIGELYAKDASIDIVAPLTYGYLFNLVFENYIINISIRLHDYDTIIPPQMPEFFRVDRAFHGHYVWHDFRNTRNVLYQRLEDNDFEGLPKAFQGLRETLDMVLNTLVMQNYERSDIPERTLRLIRNVSTTPDVVVSAGNDSTEDFQKSPIIDIANVNDETETDATDLIINDAIETRNWLFLLLLIPLIIIIGILVKNLIIRNIFQKGST